MSPRAWRILTLALALLAAALGGALIATHWPSNGRVNTAAAPLVRGGALLVVVGPSLRRRVRASLYRYLQGHSQRYFMSNFSGSLSNRVAEVSMGVNFALWTLLCVRSRLPRRRRLDR